MTPHHIRSEVARLGTPNNGSVGRPDTVDVVIKGGLIARYPLECVRSATEDERKKLPKWLKEAGAIV